jgi:hypothetical protein
MDAAGPTTFEVTNGGREKRAILALWDAAVAAHRDYWAARDTRSLTDEIKDADRKAAVAFIQALGEHGPDGVATGR